MIERTLIALAALAVIATAPSAAGAADVVVAQGASASQLTALDGTVVWIAGDRLMQRWRGGAIAPVEDSPAGHYRSIDLGRDGSGRLVLTFVRCSGLGDATCTAYSDDLHGHRASFRRLAAPNCAHTAAPSRWRARVAYGLRCRRADGSFDAARSGLFTRVGTGAPRRLRLPDGGADSFAVRWIDLRGRNVGAALDAGGASFAVSQTVTGAARRVLDIASRCDGGCDGADPEDLATEDRVHGFALGAGRVMWALVGLPTRISRIGASGCAAEPLPIGRGAGGGPIEAMAVDGRTTYLAVPGTGIVAHRFTPAAACR